MSVNEVVARKDYTGNGSVDAFAYTWRITDQTHLEVLVDGVVQTLSTDYTVSGVDAAGGGSVTFTVAPAAGAVVTLLRKQPLSQLSDYVQNEAHPSDRIEKDLDKVVMRLQQDAEVLTRSLRAPKAAVGFDGTLPAITAGAYLRANAAGDGVEFAAGDLNTSTFTQTGTGAVERTVTAKLGEVVSVRDFDATGDGTTDDSTAFTKALAAATNVFVPLGSYVVGNVVVSGKRLYGPGTLIKRSATTSGLIVQGTGTRIEGLTFTPQSTSGQPNADITLGDGAKAVRITGCTFSAPFATNGAYSAIAAAVDIEGAGGAAYATPVRGVVIAHNTFEGYVRPVFLHSVENVTITGNLFRDTNFDAIRLRENDGYAIITHNQFDTIGDPAWPDTQTRDAVDTFWAGDTLIIAHNLVRKAASIGFDVKGVDATGTKQTRRVVIAHNVIRDCRFSGIHVFGHDDYDGAGTPLHIDTVLVQGNQVIACNQNNSANAGDIGDAGIRVRAPATLVSVVDNLVSYCFGRGIYVAAGADATEQSANIRVAGNLVINNGHSARTDVQGIYCDSIDGLLCTDNLAINDATLDNPYQGVGIQITSTSALGTVSHMQIVDRNLARGNLTNQITTEATTARATGIASFFGNVQEGTGAVQRGTWQHQRALFFGTGAAPSADEGEFRAGDVIHEAAPALGGHVGRICLATGSPGTWVRFGLLTAVSADRGDASVGLTVGVDVPTQRWNTPLTATRTVTLQTTNAQSGDKFRLVREAGATGAFNLDVGTGPLKSLTAAGQWCEVEFDGSAWRLTAAGTL